MRIIGREKEQDILENCMNSGRPEFIAVYGRRRVGKTYLIRNFFLDRFAFYTTGTPAAGNNRRKLTVFNKSLREYGCTESGSPANWLEAFDRLKGILSFDGIQRDPATGRRVVFIDELPWLDSPRSDFKMALDLFWNGWASTQEDICLIVCGSATSWIVGNILTNTGGLYNRVTRQIYLQPFTLLECETFFRNQAVDLPRSQIIESYMIWGGIPYYLNYYDRRLSFAQNVQAIVFDESGPLFREHEMLFQALFTNSGNHMKVIDALAGHRIGLTRKVLEQKTGIDNGAPLTRTLQELEQCGFIRKYNNYAHKNRDSVFQLVDPFTLFFTTFRKDQKVNRWLQFIDTPSYYNWSGHAFEIVCLLHINQIKQALGIAGIQTKEFAWTANAYSQKKSALNNTGSPDVDDAVKRGAQIDLMIDRADKTITICEMKYTEKEYVVTKDYAESLIHKRDILREKTRSPKAMMIAMISANGVAKTGYWNILHNILNGDDLFK